MDLTLVISGLGLGLASSLHCVGMCGPLALALPLPGYSPGGKYLGILLYNVGRIASYAVLGLVIGLLGRSVTLAGYQQVFTISIGIFILLYAAIGLRFIPSFATRSWLYRKIQAVLIRHIRHPSYKNLLIAGAANGLLPCGMVYLALGAASATGGMATSGIFMVCFGLGTLPLMSAITVSGLFIKPSVRKTIKGFSPYIAIFMAGLLIIRGLNLNIPFISPLIHSGVEKTAVSCH